MQYVACCDSGEPSCTKLQCILDSHHAMTLCMQQETKNSQTSVEVSHRETQVVAHSAVSYDVVGMDLEHLGHVSFCGFGCCCSKGQHTAAPHLLFQHVTQTEVCRPAMPCGSWYCCTALHAVYIFCVPGKYDHHALCLDLGC